MQTILMLLWILTLQIDLLCMDDAQPFFKIWNQMIFMMFGSLTVLESLHGLIEYK